MFLRCNAKCTDIKKSSKSPAFDGLEIGDVICFSVEVKRAGYNRGTYATYIHCYNPQTNKASDLSFNQIGRTLNNFDFEELNRPLFSYEEE